MHVQLCQTFLIGTHLLSFRNSAQPFLAFSKVQLLCSTQHESEVLQVSSRCLWGNGSIGSSFQRYQSCWWCTSDQNCTSCCCYHFQTAGLYHTTRQVSSNKALSATIKQESKQATVQDKRLISLPVALMNQFHEKLLGKRTHYHRNIMTIELFGRRQLLTCILIFL